MFAFLLSEKKDDSQFTYELSSILVQEARTEKREWATTCKQQQGLWMEMEFHEWNFEAYFFVNGWENKRKTFYRKFINETIFPFWIFMKKFYFPLT